MARRVPRVEILRHAFGVLMLVALVLGCAPSRHPVGFELYPPKGTPVSLEGPNGPLFTAVSSESAWSMVSAEFQPYWGRQPLPGIDFSRRTLVVAALGWQRTANVSVSIQSISESNDGINVAVTKLMSGKNCIILPTITHPMALALIPATREPIRFRIVSRVVNC